MAEVWRVRDYRGREVVLDEGGLSHIRERHPDMLDRLDAVAGAIMAPSRVTRSPRLSRGEHVYGRYGDRLFVKVYLLYRPTPEGWVGEVRSTHLVEQIEEGGAAVAVNQMRQTNQADQAGRPRWPDVRLEDVSLAYDAWPLDTLHAFFAGRPRAGSYVSVRSGDLPADGLSLKVAEDGSEVIGLMVEGYLADGLSRPAAWMAVAPFAGVAPEALKAFGMAPLENKGDRTAAITAFLADVHAVWEAAQVEDEPVAAPA